MLNNHAITKALTEQLRSSSPLIAAGYRIEDSAYINMDPDRTPWVGVYKGAITYAPGSLGRHAQSWQATVKLNVFVQAAHGGDAEKCSELLGQYEQAVLDAIWADPTLGGTVDMITGLDVAYSYNNEQSETLYYQQAHLKITAEVGTG